MRLLKQFRKKPFCNDTHFLLIAVLLFLISLKYWPFYIVLGIYLLILFLKTRLALPAVILVLIFGLEVFAIHMLKEIPVSGTKEAYVVDVKNEKQYTILINGVQIQVFETGHTNTPGDIIRVHITLQEYKEKGYETEFDYEEYLHTKGILYSAKGNTLEVKKKGFSFYQLKYRYMTYLSSVLSESSYAYVSAMVFGENNLEASVKDAFSILGISHILAISGLHILFLYKVIGFLLLKLFHYYKRTLPVLFICFFTLGIGAPASALRACLFLVLGALNKRGEESYTRLDILSISCMVMLLMNPYQLYGTGFILSYLVSFVLIFSSEVLKPSTRLISMYKSYYLIYFSTFPVVMSFTNRISLLSLALSPLLSMVVTIILLPVSYLLSVLPILDILGKYIFLFLNQYLEGITQYGICLPVPSFSIYTAIVYYALFCLFIVVLLKGRRIYLPLSLLCLYLVLFIQARALNPYYRVTFIDCGQGDSVLIELPNNRGTLLLDAFHSLDYLKDIGITHLDAVVLTHSDSDHIGDYQEILEELSVGEIYYPLFDDKFDTLLGEKGHPLNSGDELKLGELSFSVLGPVNAYSEVNSNSLVLKTTIQDTSYLFTGDMTKEEEKDLVEMYGDELASDVLKVGHHGSDTSSGEEFLSYVQPKLMVISVARNNSYGLPDPLVLSRLSPYGRIYTTKDSGNITISQRKGRVHISTYR